MKESMVFYNLGTKIMQNRFELPFFFWILAQQDSWIWKELLNWFWIWFLKRNESYQMNESLIPSSTTSLTNKKNRKIFKAFIHHHTGKTVVNFSFSRYANILLFYVHWMWRYSVQRNRTKFLTLFHICLIFNRQWEMLKSPIYLQSFKAGGR